MNRYLITGPTVEPVTKEDVKDQARVEYSDDDAYLDGTIAAARSRVEETECWIQCITATWEIRFDSFPDGPIVLPRPPLQELLSIKYVEQSGGTETTWVDLGSSPQVGASRVIVDAKVPQNPERGEIYLAYNEDWPTDVRDVHNAIRVRFKAGFGDDGADVPAAIRHWIKMVAAEMYRFREPEFGKIMHRMGFVDGLLDPYRAREFRG